MTCFRISKEDKKGFNLMKLKYLGNKFPLPSLKRQHFKETVVRTVPCTPFVMVYITRCAYISQKRLIQSFKCDCYKMYFFFQNRMKQNSYFTHNSNNKKISYCLPFLSLSTVFIPSLSDFFVRKFHPLKKIN